MKIISISGLDGSGKSTQLKMLKSHLETQGKRVFYFHAVAFGIANVLKGKKGSGKGTSVTKANWLKIKLRKIALVIDGIRFRKLALKLDSEGYDFVLTDRFFYDSAINIAYLEGRKTAPIAPRKLPRPNIAFYLKTDPGAIMGRKEAPEQGMDYLLKKKVLYDDFSQKYGLIEINGNRSKNEIFEDIKSATYK